MIKRTIDISSENVLRMRIQHDQLVVTCEGLPDRTIPAEDIGILLIDQQKTVYTHAALVRLMQRGACVVLCDEQHLPCGLLLPLEGNQLITERLRKQITVPRPREKRLWQQIVRAKINAQAANLESPAAASPAAEKLRALALSVASGDPANVEGQAARIYWPALLGRGFRRERGGAWPNPILNYGYIVMRAAVARAIAGAGLHPSFGVHHHNRGNAFCLADDLLEPLRPLVDAAVCGILDSSPTSQEPPQVTPGVKTVLLSLLARDVQLAGQSGPLMVQLHRTAASLWGCYAGERDTLELPTYNVEDLFVPVGNADG
jgi:CRISPR-associated protein Cas1